jgi:hypothetical protein
MQQLRLFCFGAFLFICFFSHAQSGSPTSREPAKKRVYYAPAHAGTKVRKVKVTHSAQYEFYKRVEKTAREKQRILKILSKAQFSDPRYFGHKRIPKRKPSYKMRYCNECGIRH